MPSARFDRVTTARLGFSVIACLSIAAIIAPAQAQTWSDISAQEASPVRPQTYSLDRLIRLALSMSPKDREGQERARQAQLAAQLVKSQYAPQLDLKALGGIQHTPLAIPQTVSPRGYFVSHAREVIPTLELKWLLFDFGRRKGQLEEAQQKASAAEAAFTSEQEQLVFAVTKAYFTATAAQGRVRAASSALESTRLAEEAIQEQRAHGRATVVQTAEAHRQTAAAQVGLTKSSGEADTARADLVATVGLPPDTSIDLGAEKSADAQDASLPPVRTLVDQAIRGRPDIQAAKSQVDAAEASVDVAHAAYHPTISIQAQVFQNIGETSSDGSPYSSINREGNSVFLAFELPLADGGARATKIAIANSQKSEAEAALDDAKDAATQQVIQTYSELKTSLDNQRQAKAYTHAAELAYQASLDAYKHGLSTVNDLANNRSALAQAQAEQEDANANVQIAQAALALAIGTPPTS
jgi:outer membrane protein